LNQKRFYVLHGSWIRSFARGVITGVCSSPRPLCFGFLVLVALVVGFLGWLVKGIILLRMMSKFVFFWDWTSNVCIALFRFHWEDEFLVGSLVRLADRRMCRRLSVIV
jgi:hypothetical protein